VLDVKCNKKAQLAQRQAQLRTNSRTLP